MLACELDLPIGIDVPLTLLSALLAVLFTFAALASDLLWNTYMRSRERRRRLLAKHGTMDGAIKHPKIQDSSSSLLLSRSGDGGTQGILDGDAPELPLLSFEDQDEDDEAAIDLEEGPESQPRLSQVSTRINSSNGCCIHSPTGSPTGKKFVAHCSEPEYTEARQENGNRPDLFHRRSSQHSISQRSDSLNSSNVSTYGLGHLMNMAYRGTAPAKNAFLATGEALYKGCTPKNIIKGFFWSLAITSMHYVGLAALKLPEGFSTYSPALVILSALISWLVCLVGCILMSEIETHFTQQLLFAAVACTGVAAMHFTGKSKPLLD